MMPTQFLTARVPMLPNPIAQATHLSDQRVAREIREIVVHVTSAKVAVGETQVMCKSFQNWIKPSLRATVRDASFCHDVL